MVTFIDILGFRQLVDAPRDGNANVENIAEILGRLKYSSERGDLVLSREGRTQQKFHAFNFSDLTVRCTEFPKGTFSNLYLSWELLYLGDLQLAFLIEGVLLRGGICMGEIFVDKRQKIIFGPGLVKAYKLESESAVYPRIVIEREYISLVENQPGKFCKDYVSQGEDGVYFLDYLFGITSVAIEVSPERALMGLNCHREAIESAIRRETPKRDERIRQKYLWLSLYHNSTIDRLSARFKRSKIAIKTIRELRIPKNMLDF
jgi:hypothetical protein